MDNSTETDDGEGVDDKSRVKRRRNMLRTKQWLEAVFLDRIPIHTYDHQSGILIDNPGETLRHKIIDFNVEDAVAEIKEVAAKSPSARHKPVIALSRGVGGGKTRALVEICKKLIEEDVGILTASLTFNCTTAIKLDRWIDVHDECIQKQDKYALSIVARLGYCFFGGPMWKYVHIVDQILDLLPSLETDPASGYEASQLISAMIELIVSRFRPSKKVDAIVIVMDEVVEADKQLQLRDSSYILREAVLNNEIIPDLKLALVLSTLCTGNYAETLSGRGVRMLQLPDRLNVYSVVSEWWNIAAGSPRNQAVLELIATSMNSLPRVLEFASKYLRDNLVDNSLEENALDSAFVSALYKYVVREMQDRYLPQSLPCYEVLRAIFFGQRVRLRDKGIIDAVNISIITNSLNSLDIDTEFIPETSLMRLKALFHTCDVRSRDSLVARELLKSVDTVLEVIPQIEGHNIGKVLEVALCECISDRILLASTTNTMRLSDILGITAYLESSIAQTYLSPSLSSVIEWRGITLPKKTQMSCSSSEDLAGWLTELRGVPVCHIFPLALVLPYEGYEIMESWDLCIKVDISVTKTAKPLYIFLDAKSRREVEPFGTKLIDEILKDPRQYYNVKKIATEGGLDFIFIYMTTHDVSTTLLGGYSSDTVYLLLGRDETRALMGPIFEMYCAARAAVNNT